MGATVRNASSYLEKLKKNEERDVVARSIMGKMSIEQLSDLLSFYHMMGQICSEILEKKLLGTCWVSSGFAKASKAVWNAKSMWKIFEDLSCFLIHIGKKNFLSYILFVKDVWDWVVFNLQCVV